MNQHHRQVRDAENDLRRAFISTAIHHDAAIEVGTYLEAKLDIVLHVLYWCFMVCVFWPFRLLVFILQNLYALMILAFFVYVGWFTLLIIQLSGQ